MSVTMRLARVRRLIGAAILSVASGMPAAAADFHTIFEARCQRCHGHAGPFARERLTVEDGIVRGGGGREIAPFLARHAGGLSEEEAALFVAVFARQIASGGFYQRRCGICHDSARELARLKLVIRDGRLVGRYSGHDVAVFLNGHARMTGDEAAEMTEALRAILQGGR